MIEEAQKQVEWMRGNLLEEELTRPRRHDPPTAPRRGMHFVAVPSLMALMVQQAPPEPPWYDKASVIIIAVACLLAVVVTVVYPWSWRLLGLGVITLLAGVGILFARAIAAIYHRLNPETTTLAWTETLWLIRVLLVGGSVLIILGCAERLIQRWPGWRVAGRRFAVFVAVCVAVRVGLEVAHRLNS